MSLKLADILSAKIEHTKESLSMSQSPAHADGQSAPLETFVCFFPELGNVPHLHHWPSLSNHCIPRWSLESRFFQRTIPRPVIMIKHMQLSLGHFLFEFSHLYKSFERQVRKAFQCVTCLPPKCEELSSDP